jgi:putative membrane protein
LIGAAVILALIVVLGPFLFMAMMMLGMGGIMGSGGIGGMMSQFGSMGWPGAIMAISWLLVIVGIFLLLIWGIRRLGNQGMHATEEPPLTILQRRYARGEIGLEEYERIRSDLLRDGADR